MRAIVAACAAIVVWRAATAPAPEAASRRADVAMRGMLAADIAASEDAWREKSEEEFPLDVWSQRDAFHAHESLRIRELAASQGVPVSDVLRAIDEDLHSIPHASSEKRGARAVACKPRPFYD
jgi:hypothetical protein